MMKTLYRIVTGFLLALLSCGLVACGGGGGDGGEQPTEVVVTFSLNSSSVTDIGAVYVDLDLPTGFALATETDGVILAPGVVTADARLQADSLLAAGYVPEASLAPGQLAVGLIIGSGFGPGALFTVTKTLAGNESLPDPADFVIVSVVVNDTGSALIDPLDYTLLIDVQLRSITP